MGLLHYLDWLCHICHFYYVFALHFSATWSWLCCDQERNRDRDAAVTFISTYKKKLATMYIRVTSLEQLSVAEFSGE